MSMPFYVSPEQMTKDRADYARKGIARGRAMAACTYQGGVLLCAENPSRMLRKISEIYDRIGFGGVEGGTGRGAASDELALAVERHVRVLEGGEVGLEVRLLHGVVNLDQQGSLGDLLPGIEMEGADHAADLRRKFNALHGAESAHRRDALDPFLLLRLRHRHGRHRWRRLGDEALDHLGLHNELEIAQSTGKAAQQQENEDENKGASHRAPGELVFAPAKGWGALAHKVVQSDQYGERAGAEAGARLDELRPGAQNG